ncbi:MAG TPA: N-acetyl-gamma-glutamyl-phosphate reductase [Terriglobales bacterium]|nr:N-acetyl-gamma-glutamyl-phosphate reductase [Terriglobales bacterium]
MTGKLQTAVLGPTGYTGFELLKILFRHPRVKTPLLFVREGSEAAGPLSDVFPHLSGNGTHQLEPFAWSRLRSAGVELLFLATPHEYSREFVPEALDHGLRIIDLSGAWRLRSPQNLAVYKFKDADPARAAKIAESAVYGLSEWKRKELKEARLVANPGCYPTSIILALAPLINANVIDSGQGVICDSKSGVSGAGKKPTPTTHFVEVADNFRAYNPVGHRHTGEMLEQLKLSSKDLVFTPHLLPIPRGMFSTIYVHLKTPMKASEVEQVWRDAYAARPFVRMFAPPRIPEIAFSVNTNYCDLGFALSAGGERLTLFSSIDNLVKGAAGQAVQNMNLMYGWDEKEGLP